MKVRPMVLGDLPRALEVAPTMHEQSDYSHGGYSKIKMKKTFRNYIESEDRLAIAVEDGNGLVVGGILASIGEMYFSYEKVATDTAIFIHPDHRNLTYIRALINAYEEWAKSKGASRIMLSQSSGQRMDQFERLTRQMGFEKIGVNMRKKG